MDFATQTVNYDFIKLIRSFQFFCLFYHSRDCFCCFVLMDLFILLTQVFRSSGLYFLSAFLVSKSWLLR